MDPNTVLVFTRYGMGEADESLRLTLAGKFLGLVKAGGDLPAKILFYTEGVKLACQGSPVVPLLQEYEASGVELILCVTCLDYYHLTGRVAVGIVGGMPDIIAAMGMAQKVISL